MSFWDEWYNILYITKKVSFWELFHENEISYEIKHNFVSDWNILLEKNVKISSTFIFMSFNYCFLKIQNFSGCQSHAFFYKIASQTIFLLTVKSDMQWKISWQWEKVLLVFKRKVNRGKETSIGSFQDETEVIIFVWYWTYIDGNK